MVVEWAHYQRNKPTQSKRRTKVFISEPDPALRQRFGRLFGVMELNSLQPTHLRFLHALIEELEHAYYPQSAIHGPTQPIATHLEAALRHMNTRLTKLIETHQLADGANDFTFTIGALKERDLVITHHGSARALLLHREDGHTPKLIDIIPQNEKNENADARLFSSFLEGHLGPNDTVLVTTESLVDYLSLPQLQEVLTAHPARESVAELESLLDEAPEHLAFPMLVIELAPERAEKKASLSVNKLLNTERATEQILAPSIGHDFKGMFRHVTARIGAILPRKEPRATTAMGASREHIERLRTVGALLMRGARVLGRLLLQLVVTTVVLCFRGAHWVVRMLMSTRSTDAKSGSKTRIPFSASGFRAWLGNLPWKGRITFIGGSALLLIFVGSLVVLGVQRSNARSEAAFQALIKSIDEKKAQVEMNLIYRDDARAKQTLQELEQLLNSLPTNRAARHTKKQELEASVAKIRARIHKIVVLDAPERLIDVATFAPRDRGLDLRSMVLQENNIYVYGDDPLLFKVNLENQQAISFEIPKTNVGKLTTAIPDARGTILLVDDQNKLIELNPGERSLKPVDITFGGDTPSIRAGASYNDKLYLVDGKNQEIYRHQKTKTGYAKGAPWLKESINVSDAQDLVIDGSLWLLFTDGSITNLSQGKRKVFTIETIDPALTRATKIGTTFESKYVTLLDPAGHRVIVLRKSDGKLAMQYTSPLFDNLKDFIVNESKKVMYVMNGTTIYTIPLQHL